MSSHSERGFGARLRKAQDMLLAINSFPVYDPPREEESIAEMTLLVDQIIQLNTDEATLNEHYRIAVDNRQHAFEGHADSVEKLLSPIANAVTAQYGGTTKYAEMVKGIIRKMRSPQPADPQVHGVKPVSKSERSYGALAKTFNDLVTTLSQFPDYDPSNPEISIPSLQQKVLALTVLSDAVTEKALLLKSTKAARAENYGVLQERMLRVKAYIKAHYGNRSPQYSAIRKL